MRLLPLLTVVLGACASAPGLVVVSAQDDGLLDRPEAIQGRDGGPSALAWGRSVWTYGDTVLWEPDARGETWHTNSYELRDPVDWRSTWEVPEDDAGAPAYLVPRTAEEQAWDDLHAAPDCADEPCGSRFALWPSEPLVDPANDRAWILFGRYNDAHPSGIGVASWDGPDAPVVRHDADGLLFPEGHREWANAPLVHDGHLYTFGCQPQGLARPCALARVPLADVSERAAWTFWDGSAWSAEEGDALDLFAGEPIMEVSYVEAAEVWLLVTSPPFSHDVLYRTAPALTGPWSEASVLFTAPGEAPYDAQQHAELAEEGGLVQWITWSQPTGETWFSAEHHVWRVELALP